MSDADSLSPMETETPSETTLEEDLDILWTLIGSFLVFFMQCGFAMLEAGTVRKQNTINILLKNLLDSCVAALVWWAIGHSFAFGESGKGVRSFIGASKFFTAGVTVSDDPKFYSKWMFQWAFAATSATIVSGAVAERCRHQAYIVYTVVITGFVYPVVVHWVWSEWGWLSASRADRVFEGSLGLLDFAGSSVVHVTGGGAAFCAAWFLGPRLGRFDANGNAVTIPQNDQSLIMLGSFILWFGWYAFNSVSGLEVRNGVTAASLAAVNTTMSAAAGALTVLLIHLSRGHTIQIAPGLNGLLSGLVGITAGCTLVEPFAACFIGAFSGGVYYLSAELLLILKIDDPLEASAVHFGSGIIGTIAVGFFATETNVRRAYHAVNGKIDYGVFYGGDGRQLCIQLLGTFIIAFWTCTLSSCLFFLLHRFDKFRVDPLQEEETLNASVHEVRKNDQGAGGEIEMNGISALGGYRIQHESHESHQPITPPTPAMSS